jgi:crotonobetainyl-CoA:carnitine CoA-transferase CaiB-like acyl-CoA transferase
MAASGLSLLMGRHSSCLISFATILQEAPLAKDLEGLLVVSLEQAVAAPLVSSRLAQAGARVIKLERREGDFARRYDDFALGQSAYFVWLNAGKESVFIDIKDERDIAFLYRILQKADIFIHNLAPGAVDRAGIGNAELAARNPRLIICEISGYGSEGPYRDRKAYDLLVQAESGLAGLSGTADEPGRVGVSICDIGSGMYAHGAILQALYARQRSGNGRVIQVSLFHSMCDWMNVPYLQFRYGGHQPQRQGLMHPTIAPYGTYEASDGELVLLSIQNDTEWNSLCRHIAKRPELLDDPRFATNSDRVRYRGDLDAILRPVLRQHDRPALTAMLQNANLAFACVSTLADLVDHPQARFRSVSTKDGFVELLGPAVMDEEPDCAPPEVPALGAHDKAVRGEFAQQFAGSPID